MLSMPSGRLDATQGAGGCVPIRIISEITNHLSNRQNTKAGPFRLPKIRNLALSQTADNPVWPRATLYICEGLTAHQTCQCCRYETRHSRQRGGYDSHLSSCQRARSGRDYQVSIDSIGHWNQD